jgi:HPr kinase/phosphorylase
MTGQPATGRGIHATAVVYGESGVIVLGESGSGKSGLALALLARARLAGRFGALIGDDRVWVRASGGRLVAAGAPHVAGLIERRCAGVQSAPSEPGAVIRLIVELSGLHRSWPRWPSEPDEMILEGVAVPRLALNSGVDAAAQAMAVAQQLESIDADRCERGGISLEHCAAVHKNRNLVTLRMASTTAKGQAGRVMDI